MRILIDGAQDGGYQLHIEYGEDKRVTKPKNVRHLYDVLDTAYSIMYKLEHDEGLRLDLEITPEALRKNRNKDIAFWKSMHDPNFKPYIPRLIDENRDDEL